MTIHSDLTEIERKELAALRELAAGQCTIQKVIDLLGPMSIWSKAGFEEEVQRRLSAAPVAAPAPSEWVSVADRLPALNAPVLVCLVSGEMEVEEWVDYAYSACDMTPDFPGSGNGWCSNEREDVTHWMPLPAAPDPFAGIAADFSSPDMLTTKEPPCAD